MNAEEQVPLKDFSSATELKKLVNKIGEVHGAVESIETSLNDWVLELPDVANQ